MQESSFRLKANSFMEQEVHYKGTFVMDRKITYRWEKSQIELTFVGTEISKEELKILEGKMHLYGLKNTALVINQVTHEDRATSRGNRALSDKTVFYQHQVSELQKKIQEEKSKTDLEQSTSQELKTFNEDLLSSSMRGSAVYLVWKSDPNKKVRLAVENFLKVRLKNEALEVLHTVKI
jgi:hypothetical protein